MTVRCIVADPPWAPKDKLPGAKRGAARQYPVMPTPQIVGLADVNIAGELRVYGAPVADDAILFLWRLASMQQDALDVARGWGFRVLSEVVWQKLTNYGLPWFGMGRTVRASHETALICVRGRASRVVRAKNIRSTFSARVPMIEPGDPRIGTPYLDDDGEPVTSKKGKVRLYRAGDCIHSAKPDAFFDEIVEPLIGGAGSGCIEIFARRRRAGWDAIGNQLPAPTYAEAA